MCVVKPLEEKLDSDRQSLFNINRYIDTSIISGLHAIDRNTNNIIPLISYEI